MPLPTPQKITSVGQQRILVVDDEPMVTEVVERYLGREGFQVAIARDGESALEQAEKLAPDLIVLDLMLPRIDGLEVCRSLRAQSAVPIIMLTAKGEDADKVLGLGLGADDYVTKPFSPSELVARVRAVLRRSSRSVAPAEGATLSFGELHINPRSRTVFVGEEPVELTAKEFDLLFFLASSPGQVFTREQLLNQVWDYEYFGEASTVTVHVRRLRMKVERDPEHPRHIKTVWGVGYKFDA